MSGWMPQADHLGCLIPNRLFEASTLCLPLDSDPIVN